VNAVLAQRLVRLICPHCAERVPIDASVVRGPYAEELGVDEVWEGRGCAECRGLGYRGRRGIYELLVVDDELRTEVQRHRGSHELRAMAIARGMRTLQGDGFRLVRAGVTTVAEVLRVARA
jgi:type II secretory ATPase GspE/PulE/Tfp pilus assembly ATPase PilB-like protein